MARYKNTVKTNGRGEIEHYVKKNSMLWSGFGVGLVVCLQIIKTIATARLLTSKALGQVAIVIFVYSIGKTITEFFANAAIIQRRSFSREESSSIYWLNFLLGICGFMLFCLIGESVAYLYSDNDLNKLIKFISIGLIVGGIGQHFRILCQRELLFKDLSIVSILSEIVGTGSAILLGLGDCQALSLIFATVMTEIASTIQLVVIAQRKLWLPSLLFKSSHISEFIRFGLYQSGDRLVNLLFANVDRLIIGKILGLEALGSYNIAWQIAVFPVSKINPIITSVALPILSRMDNRTLRQGYYLDCLELISLSVVPVIAFVAAFSFDFVDVLLGAKWTHCASLVTLLSMVSILWAIGNPGGSIILAIGRPEIGLKWNLFSISGTLVFLFASLALFPSPEGAALGLICFNICFGWLWHYVIQGATGVKAFKVGVIAVKHISVILLFIVGVKIIIKTVDCQGSLVKILIGGGAFLLLHISYCLWFNRPLFNRMTNQ